jgi:predicted PurR-regulated permease PerM
MASESQGRLLAVLTVVAVLYGLRIARPVALPLAFALFLIALLWPVQSLFRRRMPAKLAFLATLLVLAAGLWAFGWAIAACVNAAMDRWPQYEPRFGELTREWRARAGHWGIQPGGEGQQRSWTDGALRSAFTLGEGALLTLALTILGLLEVHAFRDKVAALGSDGARVIKSAETASSRFGRYFAARTVMGVIQGVVTGAFAWAVGLDLAFVWGVLSALLNYVPTIGSALAVIPPALFALVQFREPGKALLVVGGLTAIQLVLGNYVDPRIQGRVLSLSPFVVLLSIAFWGWLWGPAGALIAVPITIAMVIAGQMFPSVRGLDVLFSERKEEAE